jgi:hypothetical protein
MSGRKRKRVTLFLGLDMQKRMTEDLGRKEAIKDHLPSGWTVFFGEHRAECSQSMHTDPAGYPCLSRERPFTAEHVAVIDGEAVTVGLERGG